MDVIAEGVEKAEQADYLKSIGCFFIQGYFYSKPLPIEEFERLLNVNKVTRHKHSPSRIQFKMANINDPESFDTWVFKTKAGPACILEILNGTVEVLRTNDSYLKALEEIHVDVKTVLQLNWMAYFSEETKARWPEIEKRILAGEPDVPSDLLFLNLPDCPPRLLIKTQQTLLAKGPDSVIIYCAVVFETK